jgi:hypothetical protein
VLPELLDDFLLAFFRNGHVTDCLPTTNFQRLDILVLLKRRIVATLA